MSLNYRLAKRKSKAEAPTTIGETMAHSIEGIEDPITIPRWYPRTIVLDVVESGYQAHA